MTRQEFANGLYLITTECKHCLEPFSAYAIQNYSPYCPACNYMICCELEYREWLYSTPTFWPYCED